MVITAARIAQSSAQALPSTTVITRADIDQTQSRDLIDLLGRQVGIEVATAGGQGSQSSLFVRGANSNQVLVLIDGVRMNTALGGAANLGGIATDSIERIEIVRGNMSALYGSEAIGGVVQIFTRSGKQPGARLLAEGGQGGTRDLAANASASLASGILTVAAGMRAQYAISAINPAQVPGTNPDIDGNRNRNGSLRWEQRASDHEISLWAWGNHNDTDWDDPYDSAPSVPSNLATQVERRAQDGFGLSASRQLDASLVSFSASQTRDDSYNASNVPASFDDSQYLSRNRQFTIEDSTAIAKGTNLVAGAELFDQYGASNNYDPTFRNLLTAFSRHVGSVWVGGVGEFAAQRFQLDVRHDRYSDFGGATTGLAGWAWSFAPDWNLSAQVATAFRAPSFTELYYPISGNPALQPERARSQELGLRWTRGQASFRVAVFRNRTSNLIEAGPPPMYLESNVARAALDGSEWQASRNWNWFTLGASLAWIDARDLDTGVALVRRARANVKVYASADRANWHLSLDVQRSGAREDFDAVTFDRIRLAGYTLARLAIARDVGPRLRLNLRIENLGNERYQLIDGFNTLPRTVVGGVQATL